ncbi:hypothetical protein COLO4_20451 [Corchorus olitorius]|uniref:Uncharacterized protein n=1 Tax=Corchorus olitorius TaxID=93759 RepID=A0A1R3IZW8_9ROSI|nr:hypothetical protein COLO4_20451 [Corchorus olitorius]
MILVGLFVRVKILQLKITITKQQEMNKKHKARDENCDNVFNEKNAWTVEAADMGKIEI